jgi:replication factor C subunit 3/5
MFLVDKYQTSNDIIGSNKDILDKLLRSFDTHNQVYENMKHILKKPKEDIYKILYEIDNGSWKYSNFQHLIVYGSPGTNKEIIINNLLQKIYSKKAIELQDVEYTIAGYSNTKTKVMIKQSKYHIVIEPNNNGFDKYLIQEIIQDYAKTEILTILKYKKLFKVVIINKIDNLSYYAQASLRRTMEKYADTCKFIFISEQLSKIIEPLKSRCLLVRVPLSSKNEITQRILNISYQENIDLSSKDLKNILNNCNNKINNAIWLLEYKKYGLNIKCNDWTNLLDEIVNMIIKFKKNTNIIHCITKIRNNFYILFITNIDFNYIIRNIMKKLLTNNFPIKVKYNIINLTSIFQNRLSQGTRYIIHLEAYILKIIHLLQNIENTGIVKIEI